MLKKLLKRRGHSNPSEGVTRITELDLKSRMNRNTRRSGQLRDFQGRGKKEVYRTCKKCGITEDPNEVQLFYCQNCGEPF
jgi:hypothetical protein